MDKIWFIIVDHQIEGPYSFFDLQRDARLTPDTMVWREDFENWLPIHQVPELKTLFEDSHDSQPETEEAEIIKTPFQKDEVIALRSDPPSNYLWILLALILLYVFYQFYG